MTTLPQTAGFAIVQPGYAVFGFGRTEAEAWADAAEWIETPDGLECWPATEAAVNAGLADSVSEYLGVIVANGEYADLMADA